ncbi:hypothetical protein SAMN05421807_101436 [Virgibacillus chiguensis]|uniref:Uncharacterized protein n=1 Tax=Virgibacillus chiguensis TaxID=411959 RepID=A0A1M5MB49_9BACI|nr:hypothetical protein SAMN05421807_101436 [Virgibacillus chiguensis]
MANSFFLNVFAKGKAFGIQPMKNNFPNAGGLKITK